MNNDTETQNEDEITLLDLFTILLRYRKLIASISLVFIISTIAGFFIYPVYKYNKDMDITRRQKRGIMWLEVAQRAQPFVSQQLDSFILHPDIIYDSLYVAGMKRFNNNGVKISLDDNNKTTVMHLIDLFWIRNLDLNGNILVPKGKEYNKIFSVKKIDEGSVFEVILKDNDPEMLKKFMESIYKLCSVRVEENMRINAQAIVSNYERLMGLPNVSEPVKFMLESYFSTYVYLKDFLDGKEVIVKLVGEPVFVEELVSISLTRAKYLKTCIMIVFTGFFLSVMLAFVLNAIRNIKSDEEAMKKIHDALGNSGSK